jgi:hypothetical protein
VGGIHLNKAEERLLHGPHAGHTLLDPVTGDSKVSVSVASLPCIACQADFTANAGALTSEKNMMSAERKKQESKYTNCKAVSQRAQLVLEHLDDPSS